MPTLRSHITWFKESNYIGQIIPSGSSSTSLSKWTLINKISEHESFLPPLFSGCSSEASSVFLCSRVEKSVKEEAVLKIWKQIPQFETLDATKSVRTQQALPGERSRARTEISAYQILTGAHCSVTAKMLDEQEFKQDDHDVVPNGYIIYILMSKVPGSPFDRDWFWKETNRAQRDKLRTAFREAWTELIRCGVEPVDNNPGNLHLDEPEGKFYFLDFEDSHPADKDAKWNDIEYCAWGLASLAEGDPYDVSTWKL